MGRSSREIDGKPLVRICRNQERQGKRVKWKHKPLLFEAVIFTVEVDGAFLKT